MCLSICMTQPINLPNGWRFQQQKGAVVQWFHECSGSAQGCMSAAVQHKVVQRFSTRTRSAAVAYAEASVVDTDADLVRQQEARPRARDPCEDKSCDGSHVEDPCKALHRRHDLVQPYKTMIVSDCDPDHARVCVHGDGKDGSLKNKIEDRAQPHCSCRWTTASC